MFRKFFTIFGTIGIFVVFGLLIAGIFMLRPQPERQEPEITAPSVFFTVANTQSVTLDVAAQGEVRPRTDINLTAQVAGRVVDTSDHFVNGGAFDEDDMLIKIEDADYRAAAAAAKARVAQAEQALRLEEAEADLARRDYEELDLGAGEQPSDLTLRIPQLAQARANFEAAQAEYDAARLNLERTTIRAPFPGRVRERIAGIGQYVTPGAQLGRIFSTDIAEIRLALTDNDLAKLGLPLAFTETEDEPGPVVRMSAMIAGETHHWEGRIARTEGAIDAATRQVIAIAVLDDPYGEGSDDGTPLAMGLYVDAVITGKPYENAIVLPRSALYGRDTVYSISEDDTLVAHKVNIVTTDRDTITIASGVEPGARIVTSPLRGASEGDEVSPADPLQGTPGAENPDEPDPASARTTAQNVTSGD
ncbi:efflux RND transporter periplasmic adaptor subunit [Hyphococcus luteus]|uniref:Efflux RND transporter periplasmic adaptor subunit n=1 Tax=Hyphococcus luteus TaxID=2058213 RepID=A0A2S7K155_9PROT|nr:efflux RND transporter periplasmic adaptor subunit [Marinicaulis flavus]PQA86196.1 efflux RND transporter periplasmic adaptor subunit [Marinicaulis flavus]